MTVQVFSSPTGSQRPRMRRHSSTRSMANWKELPSCLVERHEAAIASVSSEEDGLSGIVVAGGRSTGEASLPDVEFFCAVAREWSRLPSLSSPRNGCAVASLDARVYAFGGLGVNQALKSCESLLVNQESEWIPEADMETPRSFAAAVSLPLHEDIIVLGGRDRHWQELNSVESYDTLTKEWMSMSPMSTARFGCAAVRVGPSKVLVAGGFDGQRWLSSAEVYDYETNSWSPSKEMPESLEFCRATPIDESHILVSGYKTKFMKLYVYDIQNDSWNRIRCGRRFQGTILAAALGSNLLVTDQGKTASMIPNIFSRIDDDLTEMTSGSSEESTIVDDADKALTPWWASPSYRKSQRTVHIPEHDLEQISLLPEDPEFQLSHFHTSPKKPSSGRSLQHSSPKKPSSSHGTLRRRSSVQEVQITDAQGREVMYTGSISLAKGRPSGNGRMKWVESGDSYTGHFLHGQRHGVGSMIYGNGDTFSGIYHNDKREGEGEFHRAKDGRTYKGMYVDDLPEDSNGTMTWKAGTVYNGAFVKGNRTGKGVQRFSSGVHYEGDFVDGKYHGEGNCQFADGTVYEGSWVEGKAHGFGRLLSADGEVLFEGQWENDGPAE